MKMLCRILWKRERDRRSRAWRAAERRTPVCGTAEALAKEAGVCPARVSDGEALPPSPRRPEVRDEAATGLMAPLAPLGAVTVAASAAAEVCVAVVSVRAGCEEEEATGGVVVVALLRSDGVAEAAEATGSGTSSHGAVLSCGSTWPVGFCWGSSSQARKERLRGADVVKEEGPTGWGPALLCWRRLAWD